MNQALAKRGIHFRVDFYVQPISLFFAPAFIRLDNFIALPFFRSASHFAAGGAGKHRT
ncbi:hypothetical protein ACLBW3_12990 [Enterobacteriaceae bacterium C34B]